MNLDRVETERMILTRPMPSDEPDLYRLLTEPRVMATLGGMRSPEETKRLVDRSIAHWLVHDFGLWIMRDRRSGDFIGRGGLRALVANGRPDIEVGYALMPEAWGRGLATELARAAVHHGFATLGVPSLICFTSPTNAASLRVMQKVGFVYERDGMFFGLPQVFHRLNRVN